MFAEALPFILKEEGGYVNDPQDSGGATNRGITQKTYDAFRKSQGHEERSVQHLTKAETSKIYSDIWTSCKASELPAGLNVLHFDFAINAGNKQAAKILQRTVNVEEDGIIGPITMTKVKSSNAEDLIYEYSELRKEFYRGLATARPKDLKFLKGWLLRTNRATRLALSMIKKERSA
jgi:lysozyme family protein